MDRGDDARKHIQRKNSRRVKGNGKREIDGAWDTSRLGGCVGEGASVCTAIQQKHKSDKVVEEQQAREMDEVRGGSTVHNP